jgi:hypothetical protein
MTIQFDSGHHDFEATMVILDGSTDDAITAERIVAKTHNISDCYGNVVEAYFSAYFDTIRHYIIVYGPFNGEGLTHQ